MYPFSWVWVMPWRCPAMRMGQIRVLKSTILDPDDVRILKGDKGNAVRDVPRIDISIMIAIPQVQPGGVTAIHLEGMGHAMLKAQEVAYIPIKTCFIYEEHDDMIRGVSKNCPVARWRLKAVEVVGQERPRIANGVVLMKIDFVSWYDPFAAHLHERP